MVQIKAKHTETIDVEISEKDISELICKGGVIDDYSLTKALRANFMKTINMSYTSEYTKNKSYINHDTKVWEASIDYRAEKIRDATPPEIMMSKAFSDFENALFQYRLSIKEDK